MSRVLCVFVPGVKGTELWCDRCAKRAWPPDFIDNPLELARRIVRNRFAVKVENLINKREYECLKNHDKTPTNVIGRVKTIGGLYNREVYVNFLERLTETVAGLRDENVVIRTVSFPYDWTRSNTESAYRLYYKLMETAGIYDKIVLIAHSMGGLVCRYMLENVLTSTDCQADGRASRERLASKIVLLYGIGVPHYGCVKALHHLVDPQGGEFSDFCRELTSIYEMIPFSDVAVQIEGLDTGGSQVRRRSEIFLRDEEGITTINPRYWRLDERLQRLSDVDGWYYKDRLIQDLISRFPILHGHRDRLSQGIDFHLSLDTNRKPHCCVYLLVNATGITSPSGIDTRGNLEMHCSKGDGTVCSVVPGRKRKWLGRTSKYRGETQLGHVYNHNVHTSMLNSVNLTTPIIYFADLGGKTNDPAVRVLWNLVRDEGTHNGWRIKLASDRISKFIDFIKPPGIGPMHNESNGMLQSGGYRLKTYNLESRRMCVVSLEKTRFTENVVESGSDDSITFVIENMDKKKRHFTHIKFHSAGYGSSWDSLRIILPGFYRPVSAVWNNCDSAKEI
jgi:hypothetical protein